MRHVGRVAIGKLLPGGTEGDERPVDIDEEQGPLREAGHGCTVARSQPVDRNGLCSPGAGCRTSPSSASVGRQGFALAGGTGWRAPLPGNLWAEAAYVFIKWLGGPLGPRWGPRPSMVRPDGSSLTSQESVHTSGSVWLRPVTPVEAAVRRTVQRRCMAVWVQGEE